MSILAKRTGVNQSKTRDSNIEILRIVATIFIIAHHFAIHSGFEFSNDSITINRLWIQFIEIGGKIGVNLFILISGYFLINTKTVKINKLVKLWLQIFFYAITIFLVFVLTGKETFEIKEIVKSILPIIFSQWWFASAYFVLFLLSPYINILLKSFNKKQYTAFLALLLGCWCIIPTITGQVFESNSLLWFCFVYSISGYIKLFEYKIKHSGKTLILLSFACIILTFLSVVVFDVIGIKISVFAQKAKFFYDMQKFPILVISVLMFVGFSNLKVRYIKFINIVASASFGVYLIHDHDYVRNFLWKTLFKNAIFSNRKILIPHSLFVIIVVFAVCTIIDLLRIYLIEKNSIKIINKISEIVDKIKSLVLSSRFFK